jgi:hypothetical protein
MRRCPVGAWGAWGAWEAWTTERVHLDKLTGPSRANRRRPNSLEQRAKVRNACGASTSP